MVMTLEARIVPLVVAQVVVSTFELSLGEGLGRLESVKVSFMVLFILLLIVTVTPIHDMQRYWERHCKEF